MGIPEAARALLALGERIALSSPGDGTIDERRLEEIRRMGERIPVPEPASVTVEDGSGDGASR